MTKEYATAAGVLGYSQIADGIAIEYYRGKDTVLMVPDIIEEMPVVQIKKKAFLGAKTLTKLQLPGTVIRIGDWAFASCSVLQEVRIACEIHETGNVSIGQSESYNAHELGNSLFRDCPRLVSVDFGGGELIEGLMAAAVTTLGAQYMLTQSYEGENLATWLSQYDSVLIKYLTKDDSEGFSKMLLCGEEDYVGDDSNFGVYCSMKRTEKVRMAFLRLMSKADISTEMYEICAEYLRKCMPEETWKLVLEEHGNDKEYFDILLDTQCINADNISEIIESMGDRNAQMKGYLLKYKSEHMSPTGLLGDLDW